MTRNPPGSRPQPQPAQGLPRASPPEVGPAERLRMTIVFSLLLHAVLVLGIGFTYEEPAASLPALDVILVNSRSDRSVDDPDFLANQSQRGGGEHEEAQRPRDPFTSPVPKPSDGVAPAEIRASAPRPTPPTPSPVVTGADRRFTVERTEGRPETPKLPQPSDRELIERSLEMARLAAELERRTEQYAKRPRRKFISANTQEYAYASYMRGWVQRVERIGNLNYPGEARARRIEGQLVMTVAVRRDGTVERIDVIQSSGHVLLDDAAQRIVRLSEPFSPLPAGQEQVDVLHITRTWQFLPGGVLRNR
ncbi:MAG TPA: TonB family protein [Candidatus Saccharimonadia bacterium]|nr:TonB family protein [Candidatus Saccharimonadia bacterium]